MSISGNQNIIEGQEWVEESQDESKIFFSWFQKQFESIKAFVEDLRQLQIQITPKEDSHISTYTQAIVNYLQHPEALKNEKLYRNSIISLGNFLSIKYTFFKKEFLTQKFFKNLIQYFVILCEKQSQTDFNMLVYPVLYLVVLIIYNSDKDTANILHSKLFGKKFLIALNSVEFKEGNKIERYLPVIIAFVAKGSLNSQSTVQLKKLVLNNLHFSDIQKNQFNFIYSLRILINKESFSLAEVRKYGLLDYLVKYLTKNVTSEQHISMVLEVMKHILKRHQILCYKLISVDFLSIIESAYKVNPGNVLSLLEVICPCLPYNYKQRMLEAHSGLLGKCQQINKNSIDFKELQSLKIISIIMEQISFNDLLIFLQNYSIQSLLERTFRGDERFTATEEQDVVNFVIKIIKVLNAQNEHMRNSFLYVICKYKDENRRICTLADTYKKEIQSPLCLM